MAVIKDLLLAEVDIPIPEDYTPNMKKTETSRRRSATKQAPLGERLKKPFGQPVRPEPEDDGIWLEVDPQPIEAVIWPPNAGLSKTGQFYRLK